jgi:hypothetical protein
MTTLKGQFTRIKGSFSEARQLPRLGKIRLGIKKKSAKGVEYPSETPWFVVPQEVEDVYGKEPIELDIMLPHEDPEVFFPQKLAMYGSGTGLKCHGNGETARRIDEAGEWHDQKCPCDFLKTDANPRGACTEQSSLMVLLPKVSMGGCYQITTGSFHSTRTLNSALDYIRGLAGRLALIPMRLRRVPRVTHNGGKPQTHHTLELILDGDLKMIRELRSDIEGVLIPGRYQIEGPIDENKTLDPVDVVETDEDLESGIDASRLADMDEAELAGVREALQKKNQIETGKRPEPSKPAETSQPAQAPVPAAPPSQPAPPAKQESLELPTPKRLPAGTISAAQWSDVIQFIDGSLDLGTLKHDWKTENKVDNVVRLTEGGKQKFLEFMRTRAGAAFPY